MTLEEAENWLAKFEAWFKWNKEILNRKGLQTQRILLENFLDERMIYKLRTDDTVTSDTPIRGKGGLIKKLASYYTDDYPMIIRRHAFTTCKQLRGEDFMTWWERKMRKAHECALTTMTPDNWLELELLRGINDQNLQKRLLQEKNPALKDMVSIATAWQSAESLAQLGFRKEAHDHTWPKQDDESVGEMEEMMDFGYEKTPNHKKGPTIGNFTYNGRQLYTEPTTPTTCEKRGTAKGPMEESDEEADDCQLYENNNYAKVEPANHTPRINNVKVIPSNGGHPFKFTMCPDTGCTATLVANNIAKRQRMSINPNVRRSIKTVEGRWLTISGSVTFDIEYQGRTARVEALVSTSFEDEIFLSWKVLRDLEIGNQFPTTNKKGIDDTEPRVEHNHDDMKLVWVSQQKNEYHTPPGRLTCPGCGAKGELFHTRENCPNRHKICYNCGKQGHIGQVCRAAKQLQTQRGDRQKTEHRSSNGRIGKTYPTPALGFKGMSQYPTLPIRSLNEPGTPAEQHRQWINDEPYRSTEIEGEIKRWIKHFIRTTGSPSTFKDLNEESMKRSVWWQAFLIETGVIDLDDTLYN